MYCPHCLHEYRPGFERCGTCGVKLVETLPEPVEEGERWEYEDDLIPVFSCGQAALIPVLKSVLDAAEIPYFVEGEHAFGMEPGGWAPQILPLGVRFLVSRTRAEEALSLLEIADKGERRENLE